MHEPPGRCDSTLCCPWAHASLCTQPSGATASYVKCTGRSGMLGQGSPTSEVNERTHARGMRVFGLFVHSLGVVVHDSTAITPCPSLISPSCVRVRSRLDRTSHGQAATAQSHGCAYVHACTSSSGLDGASTARRRTSITVTNSKFCAHAAEGLQVDIAKKLKIDTNMGMRRERYCTVGRRGVTTEGGGHGEEMESCGREQK